MTTMGVDERALNLVKGATLASWEIWPKGREVGGVHLYFDNGIHLTLCELNGALFVEADDAAEEWERHVQVFTA